MSKLEESEQLTGEYGSTANRSASYTSSFTNKASLTETSRSGVEDFEEIQVSVSGGSGVRTAAQKYAYVPLCENKRSNWLCGAPRV